MAHDLETVKQLDAHAPIAAAIEAYGRRGLEVATTRPDAVTATAEGHASTAKFGQARAVVRSSAEGLASTAQFENAQVSTVAVETAYPTKAKKRDRSTGNPNGRPRKHDRIINVGSKLISIWKGDVKARFVEAAIAEYGDDISYDWADDLLTKTWDGYLADLKEQKAKADNERAMNPNVRLMRP